MPATEAWVITAGISISDSTPPSDSASVKSRVASQIGDRPGPGVATVAATGRGAKLTMPAARGASGGPRARPGDGRDGPSARPG